MHPRFGTALFLHAVLLGFRWPLRLWHLDLELSVERGDRWGALVILPDPYDIPGINLSVITRMHLNRRPVVRFRSLNISWRFIRIQVDVFRDCGRLVSLGLGHPGVIIFGGETALLVRGARWDVAFIHRLLTLRLFPFVATSALHFTLQAAHATVFNLRLIYFQFDLFNIIVLQLSLVASICAIFQLFLEGVMRGVRLLLLA